MTRNQSVLRLRGGLPVVVRAEKSVAPGASSRFACMAARGLNFFAQWSLKIELIWVRYEFLKSATEVWYDEGGFDDRRVSSPSVSRTIEPNLTKVKNQPSSRRLLPTYLVQFDSSIAVFLGFYKTFSLP